MKRRHTLLVSGLILLLLAVGIVTANSLLYHSQGTGYTIDTRDVVVNTPSPHANVTITTNAIEAAIAAMISPEHTCKEYTKLLQLVGKRLGRPVNITQKKTYAEINELVERKALDVAFVCSGPYVQGNRKFGMELLVVPVAYGKKVYYSYIIARADGKVAAFDDLRGRSFAFTDPNSNTGCAVPRYMLGMRGETPESFFKGTSYTYSHDNSIRAVAEGVADGAAVDSLIWEYLNATDPTYTSRTRIIERSPPYGIPPIVVHPSLEPRLKNALKQAFLEIHEDPEGASLLQKMGMDRFAEGDDAMYDSVRTMQEWLLHQPPSQRPNGK